MTYEFVKNAPKPISENKYFPIVLGKLTELLNNNPSDEKKFQGFFEKNPCLVPGARDEFSRIGRPSGHGPYLDTLITQPNITGIIKRKPDFMWIAYDSDVLVPVIIEIEAPSKKYFNKDGNPTAHFSKARHQLEEWQAILSRPENVFRFYEDFAIEDDLKNLRFEPHFILLYGRREEFKGDKILTQKRSFMKGANQTIMSYDRLSPARNKNFICCEVKNGKYFAKALSPTFHIGPYDDDLLCIQNLIAGIDNMEFTTNERKSFLRKRIPYCLKFLEAEKKGGKAQIKRHGKDFQMYE